MSIDPSTTFDIFTLISSFWVIFKIVFIVAFGLYFIFSLIIVRQVQLMTDTLVTEVSPVLRGLSIIHAGIALGILVLSIGLL